MASGGKAESSGICLAGAPEQLDSSAPVDQRADLYAIGAIFYEMVCGRPPFWGNAAEVQQALANRRSPRPSRYVPGVPRSLEDVIIRCLAKDPASRPQSRWWVLRSS